MTDSVIDTLADQAVRQIIRSGQQGRGLGALLRAVIRVAAEMLAEHEDDDAAATFCGGRALFHHGRLNRQGAVRSRGRA